MSAEPEAPADRTASPLRRLRERLRRHDWFGVILELLLIVAGILIGLQVDNWNRGRVEAREERAAIARLHDESEQVVSYFREAVTMMARGTKGRSETIRRLVTGDFAGADGTAMQTALGSLRFAPYPSPPRSAYDELVATGKFAGLGDPRTRQAVTAYYASLNFLQGQTGYVRELLIENARAGRPAGIALVREKGPKPSLDEVYDFAALSRDMAYLGYVTEGDYLQNRQADWWKDTLEAAEAMCDALAKADGRPCRPQSR